MMAIKRDLNDRGIQVGLPLDILADIVFCFVGASLGKLEFVDKKMKKISKFIK